MHMTPEAKGRLSDTIRVLRTRLLEELHSATESAYRMSVRARDAGLAQAARVGRARLEAWVDEQVRTEAARGERQRTPDAFRREVEKQAAYTLLNRLVILRLLEAADLRHPRVLIGGWESSAYKDFRELAPALVEGDDSEGYAFLLQLIFEDLATDLPGVYGPAGVADLVPVPAHTLRHVVDTLDDRGLESCWTDDMTLGWIYQYWNDPEREAINERLNAGGKVEPYEIASKTQMFTERYMVDWLLQNSLGPMWLAICRKNRWTAAVEADGTLQRLEGRRIQWRAKREAGEAALTDLMPLHTESERRWAYYVPQPIPDDAVTHAPASVREMKILDPAVGSGHFLVVAFDLLMALYREEARHRGEVGDDRWSDRASVERILESNLHGIDLDPRAVQIAAAALWIKAQQTCRDACPARLNLVASNLRLASLPDDDPALVELRIEVERETGIPAILTDTVVHALRGADYLGSLLKIDAAVDQAIESHEAATGAPIGVPTQGSLLTGHAPQQQRIALAPEEVKSSLLDRLEGFLARHTSGDDLGLRLRGEQLAAGVRFVRMVREGTYDLVLGNPPYQGISKMQDTAYVRAQYKRSRHGRNKTEVGPKDLYAAFLERSLDLARSGGTSALLTMRNWMFLKQYVDLRTWLLKDFDLRALGDFDRGAFEEVPDEVVSVVVSVFRKAAPIGAESIALQPTALDDRSRDSERTQRKRAAALCGVGRFQFAVSRSLAVKMAPLVYWWDERAFDIFIRTPKLGEVSVIRQGIATADDPRFLRQIWEVMPFNIPIHPSLGWRVRDGWAPYITGAASLSWIQAPTQVINWKLGGAEVAHFEGSRFGRGANEYFSRGIAFSMIGNSFDGRAHRVPSIFGAKGSSVFHDDVPSVLCLMNTRKARKTVEDLNPSVSFTSGDVARIPLMRVAGADSIFSALENAFTEHESHREPSVECRLIGPSPWRHAQEWAQLAVDRAEGERLPDYEPAYDSEAATDHVSFALGVALGRFGSKGDGVLDPAKSDLSHALPGGILFLDGTLDSIDLRDGLGHACAEPLIAAWAAHGASIIAGTDLRSYLRTKFFSDVHSSMYENRPIHWPLSSEKKTFVAWVTIHRWSADTLHVLLADHLYTPCLARLEGELADLRDARLGADRRVAGVAEKRFDKVQKWRDELLQFIEAVEQCAEKGPPPTDAKCPARDADARYVPDLDDGVMINSAALWPLLLPQWKAPKKWWKELARAQGKKDHDWSRLAMQYWPARVDEKCGQDPSLAVAHGCFWKYHPARAWAWELRQQDEIGQHFRIEEVPYRGDGDGHEAHRANYLREHPSEALHATEREAIRRRRKQKQPIRELRLLEPGLWLEIPEECWDLELRVSERQGDEFRLLAPDEPTARAAFEQAHPELLLARQQLLASLTSPTDLLDEGDEEDDEEEEADEDVELTEDDVSEEENG
jgi:hypothetical protein